MCHILTGTDWDSTTTSEENKISNTSAATSRSSKLHPWQMMRNQIFPSCIQSNPNVANDGVHKHSDDCFKHLQPINSSTSTPVASNSISAPCNLDSKTTAYSKHNLDVYNKFVGVVVIVFADGRLFWYIVYSYSDISFLSSQIDWDPNSATVSTYISNGTSSVKIKQQRHTVSGSNSNTSSSTISTSSAAQVCPIVTYVCTKLIKFL